MHPRKDIGGCLYEKTQFLISDSVYMMTESFHISLFEGTLHVDKIHAWFKIANITHELPVPVYRQTKFTPKSVVVSLSFRVTWYRCDISYRCEILAPVQQPGWLAPVWHSVVVSCNKCRAMRGNRSELAPARKSLLCHSLSLVSKALVIYFWPCQNHRDHFEILSSSKTD